MLLTAQSGCAPTEPELFGKDTTIPTDMKVSNVVSRNSADWGVQSSTARRNGFDPNLMPEFSVRHGSPQLKVREAEVAEHFFVDAFINPGEAGKCYLKVFEASKNLRLTESRIKQDSLEYVGWSSDPNEKFFFNCLIPIYEVDAVKDFAARFEIWFVPTDKTKPERKLYEDIYRLPTQHWPR